MREQRDVGLGDRLEEPVLLEEVVVLGMAHVRQVRVQHQAEVAERRRSVRPRGRNHEVRRGCCSEEPPDRDDGAAGAGEGSVLAASADRRLARRSALVLTGHVPAAQQVLGRQVLFLLSGDREGRERSKSARRAIGRAGRRRGRCHRLHGPRAVHRFAPRRASTAPRAECGPERCAGARGRRR